MMEESNTTDEYQSQKAEETASDTSDTSENQNTKNENENDAAPNPDTTTSTEDAAPPAGSDILTPREDYPRHDPSGSL